MRSLLNSMILMFLVRRMVNLEGGGGVCVCVYRFDVSENMKVIRYSDKRL